MSGILDKYNYYACFEWQSEQEQRLRGLRHSEKCIEWLNDSRKTRRQAKIIYDSNVIGIIQQNENNTANKKTFIKIVTLLLLRSMKGVLASNSMANQRNVRESE